MEYNKKTLKNGLRTIHVPMEGTKTVAVLVLAGVGSRYETKDINGISHFLEHMFFKGTKKRPSKKEIAQELDAVGASYNAYTGKEYTVYYVKADTSHTELAFDVISDMFLNSTLPAEEIEKERGVITAEIDLYEDQPMQKVGDNFEELLYGNQPVGREILGTKEVITSLQRDNFVTYHDKHYRAKNTVIVVAGNIEQEKTNVLLSNYFSQAKEGEATFPEKVTEQQDGPQIHIQKKDTDQTHLIIGTRAFGRGDRRRPALAVLSSILGGNMSSRLFIHIRDKLGLAYYVSSSVSLRTDHGVFYVRAGVEKKNVQKAISAIMSELRKVREKKINPEEIKKAKDYIQGSTLIDLESSDSIGTFYGMQELLEEKVLTPEEKFRMIEEVTAEDVQQVARDIFTDDRLNLALIGPIDDEEAVKKELTFSN